MTQDEQLRIMRKQLKNFDSILDNVHFMFITFDKDPDYTQEARDIIRSELCQEHKDD